MKNLLVLVLSLLASISPANTQQDNTPKYQLELVETHQTFDTYKITADNSLTWTIDMPTRFSKFVRMHINLAPKTTTQVVAAEQANHPTYTKSPDNEEVVVPVEITLKEDVVATSTKEETAPVDVPQTEEIPVEVPQKEEVAYTYTDISKDFFTTTDLNVRTGPSTSFEKIDRLPARTKVTAILKCNQNNWYQVIYVGGSGFCCGDYLTEKEDFDVLDYDTGSYGSSSIANEVAGTSMLGRLYIPSIGMDGLKVTVASTQGQSNMQQIANRSNEAYCLYLTNEYNKDHRIVEIGDHNTADGFKRLPYVSVGDVAYINRGNTVWTLTCREVYSNTSMYSYRDITRSNYGCVEMTCCASNGRTVVVWDIVEGSFDELWTAVQATTLYVTDDPYRMNFSKNNTSY